MSLLVVYCRFCQALAHFLFDLFAKASSPVNEFYRRRWFGKYVTFVLLF